MKLMFMMGVVQLAAGNAIESVNKSGMTLIEMGQSLSIVGGGIAIMIAGYYLLLGGDSGRPKAVRWLVGAFAGILVIMLCASIAEGFYNNISF